MSDFRRSVAKAGVLQRLLLATVSSVGALVDPKRGDLVASLGESFAYYALLRMRGRMLESEEGRAILRSRPRASSYTLQLERLASFPENTFGRVHYNFYKTNGITPDSRVPVAYIEDDELAYVMQRYREVHDYMHTICGVEVSVASEIGLKWFEFRHTLLPMTALSVMGSAFLVKSHDLRLLPDLLRWAERTSQISKFFLSICFEDMLHWKIDEVRRYIGIAPFLQRL